MNDTYQLLVTDVDGTLLTGTSQVSPENHDAIRELLDRGVPVALCTGRSVMSSRKIIDSLGLHDHCHVFFDGALVTSPNATAPVYALNLSPGLVRDMVAFAAANGIDLELATMTSSYSERETWSSRIKPTVFGHPFTIGPLSGLWERETVIRGSLVVRTEEEAALADLFMGRFRDRLDVYHAHSPEFPDVKFYNLVAPGISKGAAIEALAGHIGVSCESIVAVGDWVNDIPMLEKAGLAVAMGNAHEDVKAVADYVTLDAAEHGLAHAIRRFFP